jgi:adenosylhomocysteine nucleosidase
MTRTAIIAAMPGELKPLVRAWPHSTRDGTRFWAQRTEEDEWIAACAGAGQSAATRAFAPLRQADPSISSSPSAGPARFAPKLSLERPITSPESSTFAPASASVAMLAPAISGSPPAPPWPLAEKCRLASAYNASLVDMEAAAVARLAAMRSIPFYAIKGVSDALTDRLPDFNRFLAPDGQFELATFTLFAILRPWYWPSLVRMGENSKRASQSVAESLHDFLS